MPSPKEPRNNTDAVACTVLRQTSAVAAQSYIEYMNQKQRSPLYNLDVRIRGEFERLLKCAVPRPTKRYHILKALLWENGPLPRHQLDRQIFQFFLLPYPMRTERQAAKLFKVRPYPWLMEQFVLNFSSGAVSETELAKAAGRLRHNIGNVLSPPEPIMTIDLLHLVVYRATHPRWDQKNSGLALKHFVDRWKFVSFQCFGDRYSDYFDVLNRRIDSEELTAPEASPSEAKEVPPETTSLNMTQTDLDWLKAILSALEGSRRPPLYPLSRGPQSPTIKRLEQLIRVAHSRFPERLPPLEEAVRRVSVTCLEAFDQAA